MRPPDHRSEDYARDIAALSRVLRRVVTDRKLSPKNKKNLEKHLRSAVGLLANLKHKAVKQKVAA